MMNNYWIIPIIAFIVGGTMGGLAIYEKITVNIPNGEIELYELNQMDCPQIKARNALGSYWVPTNGEYAREKVDACLKEEIKFQKYLKEILEGGTYQDKIDAGFTFNLYNGWQHPAKKFPLDKELLEIERNKMIIPIIVDIPKNLRSDNSVNMPHLTVLKHVNNTLIFKNNDDVQHWFDEEHGMWHVGIMEPGESFTITLEVGNYTFSNHPNHQGVVFVLPSPYEE